MGPGAMGPVGGGVRGGWGWGLEVWVRGGGLGVGGGRVHAGWGWQRKDQPWQPYRSRDEEWDQEPWVHEKHGGAWGAWARGGALAAMQVEG